MKKKIAMLMTIIALLAIAIPGTLAYYTRQEQIHNVITSGIVEIELEEYTSENGVLLPYPEETLHIMPGAVVSKIPMVKNLEAACYVRAGIQIQVLDSEENDMELSQDTIDQIISIAVSPDGGWVRKAGDTDWWYYESALETDETTTPLFREVVFSGPNMSNEYQGCAVKITVTAQAVQAANTGDSAVEVPDEFWTES